MEEAGSRAVTRWRRRSTIVAGSVLLVALGGIAGATLRGVLAPASSAPATGSAGPSSAGLIDMRQATGVSCRPPVKPGRGHQDPLLAQIFNVHDAAHTAYLLGWQIVPYQGAGTYKLGTAGNLLALEPPTGGSPLGYGSGTVTFFGNADAGTVHAVVKLRAGGTVAVGGSWVCTTAA